MGYKIAFMGTGAVGAYAGAHMARAGEDVTFIDPWPANVETMKANGPEGFAHPRRAGMVHAGARAAPDGIAAGGEGKAVRHRLRLHEVLRHRMGDSHDRPVSRPRTALSFRCRTA